MNHDKPNQAYVIDAISAMCTVLRHGNKAASSKQTDTMLSVLANSLLDADIDVCALTVMTPDDLLIRSYDATEKRFIMSCLIGLPYAEGCLSRTCQRLVEEYAEALNINTNTLAILSLLTKQRIAVSELNLLRQYRAGILSGELTVKTHDSWQHLQQNPSAPQIAARYHALRDYPKQTFGYALYQFYEDNKLPLPGERYGVSNGLGLIHDMGFVLGGYALNEEGILNHAFFQAGFTEHDGILFLLIALMHYYLESVVSMGEEKIIPDTHYLRDAYRKGKQMKIDLYDNWDYWPSFRCHLDELRESLGIC